MDPRLKRLPLVLARRIIGALQPMLRRPAALQVAALCTRTGPGGTEVLLVRSLNSSRWILPKGWPMRGRSMAQAASREAWEEAGVTGQVYEESCGNYRYHKRLRGGVPVPCEVLVYRIEVDEVAPSYPEARKRVRKWMPSAVAADRISEPGLKSLIGALHPTGTPESDCDQA